MATGDFEKSRNLLARKRLAKRESVRRILLESLESRQLMAVGPTLVGIQPNEGDLLENGEVLQVSPKELVFRFDDAVGIDADTLSGIRVVRSGTDGVFERASVATDLGTNGQSLVEFYAREPGEAGNGLIIRFTAVSRIDTRLPKITTSGRVVNIELNSNPQLQTRVQDIVQAMPIGGGGLVYALRLRGSDTIAVASTVNRAQDYVLNGANTAKASTDFGLGNAVSVQFLARESGNNGLGIKINVTSRDRGGAGSPIVTVSGKTVNVELNSNSRFPTTMQEFVAAINSSNSLSSSLIEAKIVSGSSAIRIGTQPTTYSPITLTGVSDIEIVPGYIGLGSTGREVVLRFAETLPQDQYRIEIIGQGTRALLNTDGEAFNSGVSRSVAFSLALGARVESVVPQPVSRNAAGALSQQRNQIDLYFNSDALIDLTTIASINGVALANFQQLRTPFFIQSSDTITLKSGATLSPTVLDPNFYQLFYTSDTLNSTDDQRFLPSAVRYFPDSDRVSLIFSRNLEELQNPANGPALPITDLRLRVGTNEVAPQQPVAFPALAVDPGDQFSNTTNLSTWTPGAGGSQSILIDSEITNVAPFQLDFPGGSDEPGNRKNRYQDNLRLAADSVNGISTLYYNFQGNLGTVGSSPLLNAITEQQKQRVREVMSLYERHLGIRFVETASLGMTIAVGDMRAITPFPDIVGSTIPGVQDQNAAGGVYYEAGNLVNGQSGTVLDIQDFSNATLNEFGGPFQRAAMQAVGRLLGLGLSDEVEGFTVQSFNSAFVPGVGSDITLPGDVDIVHGKYLYRPDSTDIDLYQFTVPTSGQISIEAFAERMSAASLLDTSIRLYHQNDLGQWEEVAFNDDYYSSDSFIQLNLEKGNYIVGVSASGNNTYDPVVSNTGLGGRSQGRYQLRMDFKPPAAGELKDGSGQSIDGDADGASSGVFNFWFRPAGTSNTKFVDKAAAAGGTGTLASPFRNIRDALSAAQPGDVVRIVGNAGADGSMATLADNLAYEIGFNSLGQALPDGSTFDVPKGVSVMIDAGAILKMRRARVGVGSSSASVDRSGGSLLVLGTPKLITQAGTVVRDGTGEAVSGNVYFTSASDTTIGKNANAAVVGITPAAGDWGGIDFRTRVDAADSTRVNDEAQGQFLNWVAHADLRYGGGQVVVDGLSQIVTPIQMIDARPTIGHSIITNSSDAAMSATPNSFLESNFNSPAEQGVAGPFSVDYDRVGPAIYFNKIVNNSVNGLQVRIRTASGTQLESMTIPGRFDDTDIVHFLPENLVVAGTAGGFTLANEAPTSTSVTLQYLVTGSLPAGTYNYKFTRVVNGIESAASEATVSLTTLANGSIQLRNLPVGITRIYRSSANGTYVQVPYTANTTTFIDNGTDVFPQVTLPSNLDRYAARLDGRLVIDAGTIVKSQGSRIELSNGGQLIAEGASGNPIVFTSFLDNRYGAGGTFRTSSSRNSDVSSGDWGGIYVGPTSSASIDQAVISYGGGTTRIEGGFADFNAVEVRQGDLRLTHSTIENNAAGASTSTVADRAGRGSNASGAIYVLGSQPIIAGNKIQGNEGPAININANSLNYEIVSDLGRSRGAIDRVESIGNRGPLISGNRLATNQTNGMVVRGGVMTTEGVWDDTDIVHVVTSDIKVSDFNHYGGLRLMSKANQSLVVKLDGAGAGFTAGGLPLDNADRIGGSVQLIGLPGFPVIVTSIKDDTVGAGFKPDGTAQTDTNNDGDFRQPGKSGVLGTKVVIDSTTNIANDLRDSLLGNGITAVGNATFVGSATSAGFFSGGGSSIGIESGVILTTGDANLAAGPNKSDFTTGLASGVGDADLNALTGFTTRDTTSLEFQFQSDGGELFFNFVFASEEYNEFANSPFNDVFAFFVDGANIALIPGTTTPVTINNVNGGNPLGVNAQNPQFFVNNEIGTGLYLDEVEYDGFTQVFTARSQNLGPGVHTIKLTISDVGDTALDSAVFLELGSFSSTIVGTPPKAGDWRSVLVDTYSNDRNVATTGENESTSSLTVGNNNSTQSAQFLGSLASSEKNGDENQRLGFHIMGSISNPSDVDVYSFTGIGGSEVWLDIDETENSLDTVLELVDADGRTLALSNNSVAEEANPSLLFKSTDMPQDSVNPLRKSPTELYYTSATGAPKDLYSTNPRDAGMRVTLPGAAGASNLYHVRVRSSSLKDGDPANNLLLQSSVGAGLTKGAYVLQMRLRETDEIPGSGINYADIRYATNGLELRGVPGNSPLLGETGEVEPTAVSGPNNTFATAQYLGNLLRTNAQAISVAGNLATPTDVDWFSFDLNYDRITPTNLRQYFATVFDMDYAAGLGRPDTSVYVFDANGNLILGGLTSGLVDDLAGPLAGADNSDLSRGSASALDPFIGSYELASGRYFVAVTNSNMVPAVLATYSNANASPLVRLQPIDSLQLIADDHIGFSGGSTGGTPVMPVLFDDTTKVEYDLSDVVLYVTQDVGQSQTNVYLYNPFTGEIRNQLSRGAYDIQDIAMRTNNTLQAFDRTYTTPGGADTDAELDYITINTNTGAFTENSVTYDTFHVDFTANPPAAVAANDGWNPEALVFANIGNTERGFMVANRPTPFGSGQTYTDPITGAVFSTTNVTQSGGLGRPGVSQFTNVVFEFNPNTGAAVSSIANPGSRKTGLATATGPGTDIFERGRIETFTLDNLGNPITRSTQLVAKEATKIVGSQINRLLRDGDVFTLIDSFNFRTRFEFDFGPEVQILDHTRVTDGMQFTLDGVVYEFDNSVGAPTVSLGATPVKLTAGQSLTQFVDAIRNAMPSSITVGYEGGRLNFSGAATGSFTQLQAAGALISLGTTGSVGAGNVPIRVLANDTAETVAARVVQAVNSLNVPGLSATATGTTIQFFGVQVDSAGPLFVRGIGPGGIITGTAWIGNTMFAVSDEGGLYTVSSGELNSYGGTRNIGSYVASSYELRGIQFTALTNGPTLNNGGQLTQILFGLDVNGNLHAFDTTGRLQPVFANGATSVSTGVAGANGLAFSTLSSNLWHQSTRRGTDAGHGIEPTGNGSRLGVFGGTSYYFGRENVGNYDLPGGAAGAMESKTVNLSGVTAGDLPMLYFNYFLATEGASSDLGLGDTAADYMRDSFRVYISGDDGQWVLAATNNDPTQSGFNIGLADDEFDPLLTGNDSVQPLFDNTGSWRQARVSLANFAGQENVKIRIEFASAGSFGYGSVGGKGPEIRTIAGKKLVDGQSFTINGQNFEIEMGPSLALPSGSAILDGDFVTVDGTRYVFTSGIAVVSAPDIAVPFTSTMTAAQLATALANAITNNPPVVALDPVTRSYRNEANDLISQAEDTGIFGQSLRVIGTGEIGDNLALVDATRDVDFVRINVDRGSQVDVNVRAAILGSTLDSYLRVFDSEGRPLSINGTLVQNDNGGANSTDSSLSFIAPTAGTYYIAVSSSGNSTYNASVSGSTSPGLSTGNYTLEVQVTRNLVPVVDGNRLQLSGAADVQLSAPNIQLQGSLGTTGIPLFITADMTAQEVANEMQRVVADFFASGTTSVYPVRGGDTISLTGLTVTDAGPFGLTTSFTGDLFSAYNAGTNFQGQTPNSAFPGSLQSQNNTAEGVYVDDFVIGLAGRGELVTGGTNGNTAFIQDPSFLVTNPDQVNGEVLVGPYQLEIRGGQESGTPLLNGLTPSIILNPGLTIDSRLSSGISVRFNGSTSFVAGTTFTLSAGPKVLTFELDDENDGIAVQTGNIAIPFNTMVVDPLTGARVADTAQVIAARFRDIVNSSTVQQLLAGAVSATLLNGDRVGATSNTVVLVGDGDIQIPSSVGTRIVSNGNGGSNRERRQGQVVINAAKVSNSLNFGASITSAPRDAQTGASIPGTPRNTVTINNELLTPGAVIMNSQFLFNVSGGINIVGDAGGANLPTAAVPFVRLVNNTIVGGTVTTLTNTVSTIENGFVFEDGNLAFADRVSAYNVGSPAPLVGLQNSADALGVPNYTGTGEPIAGQGAVSLGRGGQLTLQFTDNFLTGSNNSDPDLVIFEVGDSEEVFVEVSADNINWTNVGRASAASPTIDLDAFGFSANSRLVYVRLSDVINQGSLAGDSVGADIDSVGAISSVPADKYAPRGLGISVTNNATATLLNNVLVNNATGVNVDNSSSSTVIGGSVYQFNTNNVGGAASLGQFPLALPSTVPLFISPGTGNLYPNLASPVIDSTIDSLKDRASLVAVKQPLGIAASPILAPQFDINGQLRIDDPTVETPAGLGESVFKDRGAQERADFVGPSVALQNPLDNDAAGLDQSQDPTIVELVGVTPEFFDIRLIDGLEPSDPNRGSGIDNSTVSSASVLVYRNDQPLVEGVDYRFGYDSTNGVIRLQSLAGIWRGQSEYTIRFVNSKESAIVAKKGSQYLDGAQFQIIDAANSLTKFEVDLGYLVSIPVSNGNSALVDGATFSIDDGVRQRTFEIDTNSSVNPGNVAVKLESDLLTDATTAMVTAINGAGLNLTASRAADGLIQLQSSASVVFNRLSSNLTVTGRTGVQKAFGLQIPLLAGVPQGIVDGQTFTINRGSGPVTFELDTNNSATSGNVPVRFSASATAAQIGQALVSAISGSSIGLSPVYDGNGTVRLGGDSNVVLGLTQTVLTQVGVAGEPASVRIAVPYDAAAIEVASLIRSAIEGAGLSGITLTSFGSRLVIGNAIAVSGDGAGVIGSIRDMAGNTLKPNQVDGSTTLTVFLGEGLDYGDAPSPYVSTDLNNGPRHKVVTGLSLGATATSDTDARLPNADLDDGVTFSAFYAGFAASSTINVNNTTGSTAYVKMWIDYNGDGDFATNEVVTNITINGSGNRTVNISQVPTTAKVGPTYARVRLSTDQASVNLPTGSSPDGEVEDYLINLQGNPFTNGAWNLDVTRDGFVSPIDALNVINWLNNPAKPKLLTLADATFAPPFVDVNGDGRITATDALLIIDYLNSRPATGEGEAAGNLVGGDMGQWGSQETVLASNWAASLFSSPSTSKPASTPVVTNDVVFSRGDLLEAPELAWQTNSQSDQVWADFASQTADDANAEANLDELLGDILA